MNGISEDKIKIYSIRVCFTRKKGKQAVCNLEREIAKCALKMFILPHGTEMIVQNSIVDYDHEQWGRGRRRKKKFAEKLNYTLWL